MGLIEALKKIGLNEKEAKIYVALLQLGQATAYQVAKRTDLKKSTVYVVLDKLVAKGAVDKHPQINTSEFSATNPKELFAIAKKRIKKAKENSLAELSAISKARDHKVRATYYEGLDEVREMYRKFLKETGQKKYVAFYAHERDTSPELLQFFKEVRRWFQRAGVLRRGVTVYDEPIKRYLDPKYMKSRNISLKALPIEEYDSNISIEAAGSYTQLFSHKYLQGIIIDNPDVADVFKQIFEVIWNREEIFVKLKYKNNNED